jgi:hypothetical protein
MKKRMLIGSVVAALALVSVTASPQGLRRVPRVVESTSTPGAGDDIGDGLRPGDRWIETDVNKEYVLLSNALGAAVWTETTQSGAGAEPMTVTMYAGDGFLSGAAESSTGASPMIIFDGVNTDTWRVSMKVPAGATSIQSVSFLYSVSTTGGAWSFTFHSTRLRSGQAPQNDTTYTGQSVANPAANTNDLYTLSVSSGAYDGVTIQGGDIYSFQLQRSGGAAGDTNNGELRVYALTVVFA